MGKSLKIQQMKRKAKEDMKQDIHIWIGNMVLDMIFTAVDQATGHGKRLKHAGALASMFAKRRAVSQLRNLAVRRRMLRQKRRMGQMTVAPGHLATATGQLRSVHHLFLQPPPPGVPELPPPPRIQDKNN